MTPDELKEYKRLYYHNNKDKINKKRNEKNRKNRDEINLKSREYYKINKKSILSTNKKYRDNNKNKVREINKAWYENNKDESNKVSYKWKLNNIEKVRESNRKSNKKHYYNNREKCIQYSKDYYKNNKEKIRERKRIWEKNKRNSDPLYKLKCNIRTMIYKSLKKNNFSKKSKSYEILGCSFNEFKIYIESKFEPWMNWNNYGNWNGQPKEINVAWDIDHIIPLDTATTEQEIIKLNHYSNLQPLCSKINRDIKRNNSDSTWSTNL